MSNLSLLAMLFVVLAFIFYYKKKAKYTLDVTIAPEDAATISDIVYTKGQGFVVAEFSIDIREGYVLKKWTGTLPRLEGYDPSRWYDHQKQTVRLEIGKNEKLTIHFDQVS